MTANFHTTTPQAGSKAEDAFQKIEYLFTILFCAELAFNMLVCVEGGWEEVE